MKMYENIKKNIYVKKGILFAIGICVVWPITSWLIFYFLESIKANLINFPLLYIISTSLYTLIFLAPFYIEINFYSVFIPWVIIRFLVFAIFGYYNGLLYEKISSKFKHSKTYFIITSLLFYYIVLGILQLIGIIFYGGLP